MATSPPNSQGRTFRGFAALERVGGAIIWGTLRPSAAEAEAVFRRWNPLQEPVICRVSLSVGAPIAAQAAPSRSYPAKG